MLHRVATSDERLQQPVHGAWLQAGRPGEFDEPDVVGRGERFQDVQASCYRLDAHRMHATSVSAIRKSIFDIVHDVRRLPMTALR